MSTREQLRKYLEMEYALRRGRPGETRRMNQIRSYFSSLRRPVRRLAAYKELQARRGLARMTPPKQPYNKSQKYTRADLENFLTRPNVSQSNKNNIQRQLNNIQRQLNAPELNLLLKQQQQKVQQLENLHANVRRLQQQIVNQFKGRGGVSLNLE